MISEPNDFQQATLKAAAAQLLGVPADAAPSDVRTALLHKIKEAEFVPPPGLVYAGELLGGLESRGVPKYGPSERVESFTAGCEQALREEVEQFADSFFSIPVPERREQFFELQNRAENFPRLKSRLRILEYGLLVDLAALAGESPQVLELAQRACALHVLRPHARAQLRQAMLADLAADGRNWEKPAALLQKRQPAISFMAPDLIPPLAERAKKRRQLTAKTKRLKSHGVVVKTRARSRGLGLNSLVPILVVLVIAALNVFRDSPRRYEDHTIRYVEPPYTVPAPKLNPSVAPNSQSPVLNLRDLEQLRREMDERDTSKQKISLLWPSKPTDLSKPADAPLRPFQDAWSRSQAAPPGQNPAPLVPLPPVEPDSTSTP